jgi:DNA-binding MarR family transcriptional regulator
MASFDRAEAMRVRETCVCLNARKFARVLTNASDEALSPTGLRLTQFSLLTHLRALGRATVTDLTSAMDLDQTTVSRNVDVLRRVGLLAAARVGRARVITLTTAGQAALDRAYPLWASHQAALVAKLGGEAGWSALRGDLARLTGGGI